MKNHWIKEREIKEKKKTDFTSVQVYYVTSNHSTIVKVTTYP